MDCPSEEALISMKLEGIKGVQHLSFDIPNRELSVIYEGELTEIETSIHELKLGDKLVSNNEIRDFNLEERGNQKNVLLSVLIINFVFFLIEITTGLISKSMGLVADSLDMLADSFVYGISLFAVGGSILLKKRIARIAGYFQIFLAVLGFAEVLRRFLSMEALPDFSMMIIISVLALIANAISLYILQKSKSKQEAHMKASMIFTSNDILINVGVILAAVLVKLLNSNKPDLIIGVIVFILVIQGAVRILKLGK